MKHVLSVLALAVAQVAIAAPAAGAVDEETVKALIDRIEKQEARIAELERAGEGGATPAAAPVSPPAPAAPVVAGPKIETKGGLKIESADGKNSFSFGGRIQADVAQYGTDQDATGSPVFADGTAFRRVRFDVKGKFLEDWGYRVQYDFLDSGSAGLKDAYISFERYEPWNLHVGQFFQPFGLERQTSSNNITFLERAMPTNALTPDRHLGIQLGSGGTFGDGKVGDLVPFWTIEAGIFGMRAQDDNASAGDDESRDLTGRVTVAPVYSGDRLLQIGASYRFHEPNDAGTFARFRDRPEAYVSQVRLVDTGDLSGGTGLVKDFTQAGVDVAAIWGPWAAQGEWMKTDVDRGTGLSDPTFTGGYAQVSWLMTGESRGFKPAEAVHDKLKPKRAFGDDGWGAWELGLRYSTLDLTDAAVIGGQEDNLTVGLNWYPSENLRFMANYVKVLDLDRPGNDFDQVEPEIFQLRAQVTW
jgi:phosphate-selective porin OprO/OprP